MKNYMKIDDEKREIIMDKTFYEKSRVIGSEQYKQLQLVRKDYPDFIPVRRKIKKPDHTIDRGKGLTYDFMENYIGKYEPVETRSAVLATFNQMKDIAKAHAVGNSYNSIKRWFLEKYPEVDTFKIEEIKEERTEEPTAKEAA